MIVYHSIKTMPCYLPVGYLHTELPQLYYVGQRVITTVGAVEVASTVVTIYN